MDVRRAIKWISYCACLTVFFALLSACSEDRKAYTGIDLTGAAYARDFALTDHHGKARTLKDFAGKVVVIFFGYTQCPDVCPTSMLELAEAKKLLGSDGARVQGLFVTVDPARDTPEVLKAYMENFDPDFLALRGTATELDKVAREYRVYYKRVDGPTPTSYSMDHSAGSYVYDAQGRLRLYARYGIGAPALAADIRLLLG